MLKADFMPMAWSSAPRVREGGFMRSLGRAKSSSTLGNRVNSERRSGVSRDSMADRLLVGSGRRMTNCSWSPE